MSGGVSANKADSSSRATSKDSVWEPQGDALQDLYGSASDLFGGNAQYQGAMNDIAQSLGPYMQNIMQGAQGGYQDQLGGGSYGDTSDARNMLMDSMRRQQGGSNMGKMYQSIVGGEGNTYIDPMVDAMKQGGMENLQRMQSNAGMDAASAGQGGGSRHAMQNAMLGRSANQDMLNKEAMMRGGAYDTDLKMKMDIARQADQGIQNTQSNLMSMLGGANQAQQQGMNFGGQMQNLGMGSMAPWQSASQQPWNAMNQYAGVIGGPTVLSSANQRGSSASKGGGIGGSMAPTGQ